MTIQKLDHLTIGKIAAGEVVERPASVVKELIENALDAGSTRIQIAFAGGGTESIEVSDNGFGIAREQIPLALARHATSKLAAFEDLDTLSTLGFRGEALPSIAAVADLSLTSRPPEAQTGFATRVEYGHAGEDHVVAASHGTTITVANLFGNVPARRKFLRKPTTESAAVVRVAEAYALARPDVAFTLECDGRKLFSTQGACDDVSTASQVLGAEVGNAAFALSPPDLPHAMQGINVSGWICAPAINRATRQSIVLFVNGRWIQNRTLTYALEEAFHTLLMVGRHPVALIRVQVPPDQVDVNVHPTKAEVKFVDERSVARAVARTVHASLAGMPQPDVPRIAFDDNSLAVSAYAHAPAELPITRWAVPSPSHDRRNHDGPAQFITREVPVLRVLGQISATYIIAEGPEGLYLIDQHAAHERVLYEQFQTRLAADTVERQAMLDPLVIDVSAEALAVAERSLDELNKLGFEIALFGEQSVVVRTVPVAMVGTDIAGRFRQILQELDDGGAGSSWLDSVAISVACHASIRAGQLLSLTEMRELVQQLERTQHPRACGHGRPTMLQLTQSELEKQFGRR